MIRENIEFVEKEITEACSRAGRDRNQVSLIAVSKTKPVGMLQEAYNAGIRDFGENRVQELMEKMPVLPADIRWHMIGHLQRNKVKYIVGKVWMIHSVDSLALAEEISKEAVKKQVTVRILLEVNVAEEESKFGVTVQEALGLAEAAAKLPGIRVEGLMTIAPYTEVAEENRIYFLPLLLCRVEIFVENGADLILGTHPHVIEPIEQVTAENGNQALVYFSLGNFVNWTSGTGAGVANRMVGGMAQVTVGLDENGEAVITEYGVLPVVCHLEKGFGGVTVYPLSEYTEELAARNEILKQDESFSLGYCQELAERVFGNAVR